MSLTKKTHYKNASHKLLKLLNNLEGRAGGFNSSFCFFADGVYFKAKLAL